MAEADATTTELEAIRAVVSAIEWTQRAELVDEFMDLFAANAIWTTSSGVRLIGREQIREGFGLHRAGSGPSKTLPNGR